MKKFRLHNFLFPVAIILCLGLGSCRKSGCPATQEISKYQSDVESGKIKTYKTESGIFPGTKKVNVRKHRRKVAKRKIP